MRGEYGIAREGSGIWRSLRAEEQVGVPASGAHAPCAASDHRNDSSSGSSSHVTKLLVGQSAPLDVPIGTNTKRRNSGAHNRSVHRDRDDHDHHDHHDHDHHDHDDHDDVDEDDEERVPPHELIARRLARRQISSFSVLHGAGRTLKGRDLSKLRNAVLTKTGFLESL